MASAPRMAVTLAERQGGGPILGPRRRARKLMEKFVIEGGVPLSGTMIPAGNKNGALPILAASVLTDEEVLVGNVPRIRDVEAMLEILRGIGVEVSWRGPNEVALCGAGVHDVEIEPELAELIRASFLLAGPLLARFHRAVMPPPGGDVIGRRRLDPHLDAFRAMGARVECGREIVLSAPLGLRASDVFMDEPSVMATENALMAAALTPGTTLINNAACEPHVQRPRPHAREDGRRHPGHRLEPDHGERGRAAARLRSPDRPRPHRDRQLHGARGRHRRRAADQGHRPGRPAHDPARVRAGRPALRVGRATT